MVNENIKIINKDNISQINVYYKRKDNSFKKNETNKFYSSFLNLINIEHGKIIYHSFLYDIFFSPPNDSVNFNKNGVFWYYDGVNIYFKPHIKIHLNSGSIETKYFDSEQELKLYVNNNFNDFKYLILND